eukprot:c6487_g1_i1.p1 GENE.c6487_g1_i1~~c6487_g1_i1.p1  ORF type:complete len:694 (-),score=183.20 c6487_g1_i1:141-2099(-)
MQRKREKARKAPNSNKDNKDNVEDLQDDTNNDNDNDNALTALDVFQPLPPLKCESKIASVALCRPPAVARNVTNTTATTTTTVTRMVIAFQNNSIQLIDLVAPTTGAFSIEYRVVSEISSGGHSSDVRYVAINKENSLIASTASGELKIWNVDSRQCIRSIKSGYGLCCFFVPGNRQVVVGTKEGAIEILDLSSATILEKVTQAHKGAIWGLSLHPEARTFVSVSADKSIKFWSFQLLLDPTFSDTTKRLTIQLEKTLEMSDELLAVHITPNGKHVAVALLDCTVKVFFEDTLKFFLSLYGHKLPVLCLDSSSDGDLLISGSGDKNVKIWGLDFGDCHRSLFAHDGPVTQVKFVPQTHHFFSTGKDGLIRYWDADKFEMILSVRAHFSDIWGLAISSTGTLLVSSSRDRSIRFFEMSDEQVFIDDEREKDMEKRMEQSGELGVGSANNSNGVKVVGVESAQAGRPNLATMNASERLIDALEEADREIIRRKEAGIDPEDSDIKKLGSVLLAALQKTPSTHVLDTLASIPAVELESSLVFVPLSHVLRLMEYLRMFVAQGRHIELSVRCLYILTRAHHTQITSTPSLLPTLTHLTTHTRTQLTAVKDILGTNLAALQLLRAEIETVNEGKSLFLETTQDLRERQDKKKKRRRQ